MDNASVAKKKKKKRPPAIKATLIALAIMMVIITTLAMFTSRDLITNRFESGKIDIVLLEPHWSPSSATNVLPGDTIPKDPQVKNNEDIDVYVFLKVTVPCVDLKLDSDSGTRVENTTTVPMYKFVVDNVNPTGDAADVKKFNQVNNSNWQLMTVSGLSGSHDNKTYTYLYAYTKETSNKLEPLKPGEVTDSLFDKLILTNFNQEAPFDPSKSYSVNIEAYGIQANYLDVGTNDPTSVWNKIAGS